MNANDYQQLAGRTLIDAPEHPFTDDELAILFATIKLGALTGKAMDYVKKAICHRHGYAHHELGGIIVDISAAACDLINIDLAPTRAYDLSDTEQMLLWSALGLGGETGEVLDNVLAIEPKELGDVLWYVAALCTKLDVSLADVMTRNIEKLKKRYPDGYSSDASKVRVDVEGR